MFNKIICPNDRNKKIKIKSIKRLKNNNQLFKKHY